MNRAMHGAIYGVMNGAIHGAMTDRTPVRA